MERSVLEGLALWYLTCHESELMARTRGEIMDEGVSRFRKVRSISCSLDIRVIRCCDEQPCSTEREFVFSSLVIASRTARHSNSQSTGWYYVRVAPIKRCRNLGTLGPCNAR